MKPSSVQKVASLALTAGIAAYLCGAWEALEEWRKNRNVSCETSDPVPNDTQ